MKSRKTTFDERLEIVQWTIENNMNYKKSSEKFNVNYATVYIWTRGYLNTGFEILKHEKRGPKSKMQVVTSSMTEVEILRLELERERTLRKKSEFEIEVLKKKKFELLIP